MPALSPEVTTNTKALGWKRLAKLVALLLAGLAGGWAAGKFVPKRALPPLSSIAAKFQRAPEQFAPPSAAAPLPSPTSVVEIGNTAPLIYSSIRIPCDPLHPEAEGLSRRRYQSGDLEGALASLRCASERQRGPARLYRYIEQVRISWIQSGDAEVAGDLGQVVMLLEPAFEMDAAIGPPSHMTKLLKARLANAHFYLGLQALDNADLEEARREMQTVLRIDSQHRYARAWFERVGGLRPDTDAEEPEEQSSDEQDSDRGELSELLGRY